jgi:hypothetical protein
MAGEHPDLAGKVSPLPIVPLPRDFFARGHAPKPLDPECCKVSQYHQLVYPGECHVLSVCRLLVCCDLFSQLWPPSDFFLRSQFLVSFLVIKEFHNIPFLLL